MAIDELMAQVKAERERLERERDEALAVWLSARAQLRQLNDAVQFDLPTTKRRSASSQVDKMALAATHSGVAFTRGEIEQWFHAEESANPSGMANHWIGSRLKKGVLRRVTRNEYEYVVLEVTE